MQNKSRLAGTQYMIMMIVWVVAGVIISGFGISRHLNYYSSNALCELEFLVPVVVLLILDRFEVMRGTRMKAVGIRVILWSLLLSLLLLPVMNLLNMVSQFVVPNAVSEQVAYYAQVTGSQIWSNPLWLNLLYIAVLPAIVEEFIFRGVLYQGLRNCGLSKTVLITSVMFGLAHGNLNQFLYSFVIGIFLALLTEASGSIFTSMIVHGILNAIPVLFVYTRDYLPKPLVSVLTGMTDPSFSVRDLSLVFWIIMGVVVIACIILGLVVLRQIARSAGRDVIYLNAKKGRDCLRGKLAKVFSVPMLIGLVIPVGYIGIMMLIQVLKK